MEAIWAHFVRNFVTENFQKSPNLFTLIIYVVKFG